MAVPDNYEVETAVGTGATIVVSIAWDFEDSTELDVWLQNEATAETKRASLSEITFTVAEDKTSATVQNFWEGESAKAYVARQTPQTQTYDPAESEALNPTSLIAALDKAIKLIQEGTSSSKLVTELGGELDVQYSADAVTWSETYATGDIFIRLRYSTDGTWTEAIRIGGTIESNIVATVLDLGDISVTEELDLVPGEVQKAGLIGDVILSTVGQATGVSRHLVLQITAAGDYRVAVPTSMKWLGYPPADAHAWAATTAFILGQYTVSTAGDTYECTTAGTTGGTEPTWDTDLEDTTVDGTVTWTRRDADVLLIPNGLTAHFDILTVDENVFISGGVEDEASTSESATLPAHGHPISAIVDLQTELDSLQAQITALAALSPTADEKAALAGTGTPSGANVFVTSDDSRLATTVRQILRVEEQAATGTAGPALAALTYNRRALDTVVSNSIVGCTVDTGLNQITLPAGTYEVKGIAKEVVNGVAGGSGTDGGDNFLVIYNVSDSGFITETQMGEMSYLNFSEPKYDKFQKMDARFVLAAEKTIELRHYTVRATIGGYALNAGTFTEKHSKLWIEKV